MMRTINKNWFYVAAVRAIKTMAQTALGMITVGAAISEVSWQQVLSVAAVSGLYSILTTLSTGIPENMDGVVQDGQLLIDTSGEKDIYRLNVNGDLQNLAEKKVVSFKVKPGAKL